MKVTLYMAMAVNGIIARENNEEDFLSHYNLEVLCRLAKEFGCFIWGRKTYEVVQTWGEGYMTEEIKNAKKIVISRDAGFKVKEGYEVATSPSEALKKLAEAGFAKAILTGGSQINSAFAKEGLIDEILLNIEPVFIGKGIPLFALEDFQLNAKLVSVDRFGYGGVSLRYEVVK